MRTLPYLRVAVDELLQAEDSRLMQSTVYDTCWAARLTGDDGRPIYPELLHWVATRQFPDGSWGSRTPYVHDRLLTTLAVVLMLAHHGIRQDDQLRRSAGERYVWRNIARSYEEPHRTIGFEIIFPALMAEARKLGLELPYAQAKLYEKERARKLRLLTQSNLFDRWTSAVFSLEGFADAVSMDEVKHLLESNGSAAGSPAATACLLANTPDWKTRHPQSSAYLENLLVSGTTGLPPVAPYDIFMRSWMLYYMHHGNLEKEHADRLADHQEYLLKYWRPQGVGTFSLGFADSDSTAVALLALRRAGYEIDGSCLLAFEREQNFATLEGERDPSVSSNLHVLEASDALPERDRDRSREKILNYLMASRQHNAYWKDKWHASVYYPTSRALMILPKYLPTEMLETLRWLQYTQRADGSWGYYKSTVEETAMVLLALLQYHRTVKPLPEAVLHRAVEYLAENERPLKDDYDELWIGKTLYAPTFAIRGATLAALNLFEDTL